MYDVIQFFKKFKCIEHISDVEEDIRFQEIGVDLVFVGMKNGIKVYRTIEVKTTNYPEQYYFIEIISNSKKHTLGCFLKCQAEWIIFYFKNEQKLHMIKMNEFRSWFLKNDKRFKTVSTHTTNREGKVLYSTIGKLVPCEEVMNDLNVLKYKLH